MVRISYPTQDFRIREKDDKEQIFDAFRKQWVRLTPEEWVRQNILQYLVQTRQYPASLIAIEKEIALGDLRKRFDILVYHRNTPWMVIECKEMSVPITESVLRQALHYNISLQTKYLVITNGVEVFVFSLKEGKAEMEEEFPGYPEMAE
ncbi:type I restriction enzyme HsdR N-terminal domain-containing protein [Sediminibacterium soli]|uniref:type I restriction enzyme HsdR N-terminal domain-containing protein n=1 Tax=Sediminibacterium soli TaxID=2698829 RepID=UPI001379C0C3|nr:type I restriction enzyme HsdR N-terminal domain-containing protein [Sediminibacterium soli]NCI48146.1 type I restriction enzyme HsdR N-terminal domain-containing protein [Sediminibacterium soli]